ncbi:BT4734/BF3469 family protein, partial [Parabacteroides goldsteinii]|uniref:BT4734/BF3469 family protein n=1 Tax=Parabacteroides goldsteinii TaxID=328812 RepID=UPI001F4FD2BA
MFNLKTVIMDLNQKQTVECTLYFSAFDTQTLMLTTLERYIADVRSGKHKKAVEKVQAYLAASENEKAEAGKKILPLLVPGGAMAGGRKLEHMVRYSGCICFDLDDVLLPPEQILSQAVQLGYVKAGHISPSHTENKLFVLVDSDQEHHLQAFEQVRAMIENDLSGVTVDISGKDANRGCFASYDPDAFYKEVAEVVHVPQETVPVAKKAPAVRASSYPDNSLSNYIDKFEANNPFAGGGRHSFVLKLASALNSAGFDENEVMAECLRRYVEPGFAEKEIRGIVADVYRRYRSSHGSNPWCPPTASTGQKSLTSVTSLTPISENPTTEGDSPLGFDIDPDEVGLPHFD